MEDKIKEIEIQEIHLNPHQPRKNFSIQELEELAASIQEIGLIHAPVVREIGSKKFELIAGERRLRAMKMLGWSKAPVVIKKMNDSLSAHLALIENIQRIDLNPLEVAYALKELSDHLKLTQEQLADKVGKKRSTVANFLRLLQLPIELQTYVRQDKITMGHAKAILSLSLDLQKKFCKNIIEENMSVRQAEQRAKKLIKQKEKQVRREKPIDVHLNEVKNQLEYRLGTKVVIHENRILIEYYGFEDLERLLEILGINDASAGL